MAQYPDKHCSKCGKKGQDLRGTMFGHERIIFSVDRTRHAANNSTKIPICPSEFYNVTIDWVNSRIRL